MAAVQRLKTISEFHRLRGLPTPQHPLISVLDYSQIKHSPESYTISTVLDFFNIALKKGVSGKIIYGQKEYDFDDGIMFFIAPNQVFKIERNTNSISDSSGWMLLVHPDFIWNTPLAKTIKKYEYFGYSVNEALFLSTKEEATINGIIQNIQQELNNNIDQFSQQIIISQIETLLNYAKRFYQRQFITRKKANHQIVEQLENLLTDYFNSRELSQKGLPTVQLVSEKLNISVSYLRGLLKTLTGQSTQQHIHDKLIEKAKEKLSTTNLSISEIAYELGFEYPQSFSKLFKIKTNLSPIGFRQSFN